MRLFLLVGLSVLASASAFVGVQKNYHEDVGIPLAERIKASEDATHARMMAVVMDSERIVGGAVAPINDHPYLAGLVIRFFYTTGVSTCGSSIISANRLVTAAHCWNDGANQAASFEAVFGSQYLFWGGSRILTTSVVMHPQWTPSLFRNDIAMIYLPSNLVFSTSIQPIALPSGADLFDTFAGQWSVAAGYGKTNDAQTGVSTSSVVSHVNLQVITTQLCQATFGATFVTATNICTGGWGGVGICGGDSGGPLIILRNGRPVLVGISSFVANAGCQLGHPSAFARVTSFYNFIQQHL